MSENLNSAVHTLHETHSKLDGASAAISGEIPIAPPPRSLSKKHGRKSVRAATVHTKTTNVAPPDPSKKRSRHSPDEILGLAATARPATLPLKPMNIAPGTSSKKHGRKSVRAAIAPAQPTSDMPPDPSTKRSRKVARPADHVTKPTSESPGTLSKKRGRQIEVATQMAHATARPANHSLKPNTVAPGNSSKKRGRHLRLDAHTPLATARPANLVAKPISPLPGDSFSGDRTAVETQEKSVSARRSITNAKTSPRTSGVNSEGQASVDAHRKRALKGRASLPSKPMVQVPDHSLRDGHLITGTQFRITVAGDDHVRAETHLVSVIATIQELWKRRQSWHRAEKSLTLQCSAYCRRAVGARGVTKGMNKKEKAANKILLAKAAALLESIEEGGAVDNHDALITCLPLIAGRAPLRDQRKAVEKELDKLAKSLPVYPWIEATPGVAAGSLAAIVGECGDIGSYKSASALWKRMGLAVIDGGRQRRVAGVDALAHGYSPQRRSVMWNIGGGLIGGMGKGPRPKVGEDIETREDWSPYQKEFVRLLRLEVERVTDTWNGPEHKREPVERKGETYESFSAHAAARIKRRIEKQFLAELYGAWREIAKAGKT